jgi:hypothetical protein
MKNYKTTQVREYRLVSITCDVCKKEFKSGFDLEFDDMISLEKYYGGDSPFKKEKSFGDESIVEDIEFEDVKVSLDICQHCLKEKLGDFVRIDDF